MILDTFDHAERYANLHPGFREAFDFLGRTDLAALPSGRHAIDGDRLFVLVQEQDGLGIERAKLEAHRTYIDIQFTIRGREQIGWMPVARCREPEEDFDAARDIIFYRDRADTWIVVPAASFAVFFPQDAHAPMGGTGAIKKAVVKIAR
jgi:YhcH/YjgK/YiaL family protein